MIKAMDKAHVKCCRVQRRGSAGPVEIRVGSMKVGDLTWDLTCSGWTILVFC